MKLPRRIALVVGIGLLAGPAQQLRAERASAEPKTEELRGGRWIQVEGPAASTQPSIDPELLRVEEMIASGQFSAASRRAIEWYKANPASPQRDRALLLIAEGFYRYGDRIRAFYYLDELMDTYPDSPLFGKALEKQYQISEAFLNGYKSRFMGFPILGREDEAIDMLYRIQQRSPGSPLAERALLRTADYYYANEDYDLAADAYGAYVRSYPRSPKLAQVKLRQALSNLALFRGVRFDATPVMDAKVLLKDLMVTDRAFAESEGVPDILQRIDNTFARKLFVTADWYRRTDEPVAAVFTYRFLMNAYPESVEAQQAQSVLSRMPPNVLTAPGATPNAGPVALPSSTRPAAP